MIGPVTNIAERPHRVTFQTPGKPIPDGDGGYTQEWTDLEPPAMFVKIEPATQRSLERVHAGVVFSEASHIVTGPFHPQVTMETRLVFGTRILTVIGFGSPEELHVELVLVCSEVVQ